MKFCPKCSRESQDDDSFCTKCGHKFECKKITNTENLATPSPDIKEPRGNNGVLAFMPIIVIGIFLIVGFLQYEKKRIVQLKKDELSQVKNEKRGLSNSRKIAFYGLK